MKYCTEISDHRRLKWITAVMRIRIIFSLSVMQFQTFLELSYNL